MTKEDTLKSLLLAVRGLDFAMLYFKTYLNDESQESWDKFYYWSFAMAHIHKIEKKDGLPSHCSELKEIWASYEATLDLCGYAPHIKEVQKEVILKYSQIRNISAHIIKDMLRETNYADLEAILKSEYPESYYLLQTLKEELLIQDAS